MYINIQSIYLCHSISHFKRYVHTHVHENISNIHGYNPFECTYMYLEIGLEFTDSPYHDINLSQAGWGNSA